MQKDFSTRNAELQSVLKSTPKESPRRKNEFQDLGTKISDWINVYSQHEQIWQRVESQIANLDLFFEENFKKMQQLGETGRLRQP